MLKKLSIAICLLSMFMTINVFATTNPCKGFFVKAVGQTVCAKLRTFSIAIPTDANSQMAKMHEGFGKQIDNKYKADLAKGKNGIIPEGVDNKIRQLSVYGEKYQCKNAKLSKHDMLYITGCKMVKG